MDRKTLSVRTEMPEKSSTLEGGKKLLFVVNVDWFFLSHRRTIALAAKEAGYDVYVAAADTGDGEKIRSLGLTFIPLPFTRKGTRLKDELTTFFQLHRLYKSLQPDVVHHVTIKPVLFGSLVAWFRRNLFVVNAITGLGFMFSSENNSTRLSFLVRQAYRIALRNPRQQTIFQNPDDRNSFVDRGFVKAEQSVVIRGSGVDCDKYTPARKPAGGRMVLLASRMIRDKGILEFYEAAKTVRMRLPEVRFVLAGMSDDGNPNAVPVSRLEAWNREGIVEWLGHRTDMVELLQESTLVVLPTIYPEGTPKILIEAAACGKPIVTTDRPGCREIVQDGVNGFLVQAGDRESLADAIFELLGNPEKAGRFGEKGRELALNSFSDSIVVRRTLDLYERMLAAGK